MSEKSKAQLGRDGPAFVPIGVLVPVAHLFATENDGGSFRVDPHGFGDSFDLTFNQLDAILVGACYQCGAAVDHRQDVEPGEGDRLPIDVALISPPGLTDREPDGIRQLLESGWRIGPLCNGCRFKRTSVALKSFLREQRCGRSE